MATKKASAKKSSSSRASTKPKSTSASAKTAEAKVVKSVSVSKKADSMFPKNLPNIILAELFGTFILTMVAFSAFGVSPLMRSTSGVLSWVSDPLFVGLALTVIVMALGTVSGVHINPAVTFGLWVARKIKLALVPVYWLSQFVGALLAVGILNVLTRGSFTVDLGSFASWDWAVFAIELIGTAIFLFGVVAILSHKDLSTGSKAIGIGMSLTIALIAGLGMLGAVQKADYDRYTKDMQAATTQEAASGIKTTRALLMNGPVLNPAVAVAVKEDHSVVDRLESATGTTATSSRFGLEEIVGTLVGAALGAGLYMLVTYRPKNEQ